jgi:predicted enzyme related to lactoylglutathione lyase
MNTPIHWFEIFVADMERAVRFYQTTLGIELRREEFTGKPMAIFSGPREGAGGALVRDPARAPGDVGTLVYLDADGKLDACLARVARAGGAILLPKTDIGEPGFIALVRDTEGNSVGLHSERGAAR